MAENKYKAVIEIGSAVAGSFGAGFGFVSKSINSLGESMRKVNAQQRSVERFQFVTGKKDEAQSNLAAQEKALKTIEAQLAAARLAHKAGLISNKDFANFDKQIERQTKSVAKAKAALAGKSATLAKMGAELKATGVNTSNLSGELKRLGESSERTEQKIEILKKVNEVGSAFREMRHEVLEAGAVIGGTLALIGGTLFETAHKTVEYTGTAKRAADELGITTQAFQELGYAASQANISGEEFNGFLEKMTVNMTEAAQGAGEAAPYLRALFGSDYINVARLKPDEMLDRVADALKGIQSQSVKIDFAKHIFGKGSAPLLNMFKDGSPGIHKLRKDAADIMGGVSTDENIEGVEKFEKAWTRLKFSFTGVRNVIGAQLIPVFTRLFGTIEKFIASHGLQIDAFATQLSTQFEAALPSLIEFGKAFGEFAIGALQLGNALATAVGGWGNAFWIFSAVVGAKALLSVYEFGKSLYYLGGAIWSGAKMFRVFATAMAEAEVAAEGAIPAIVAVGAAIAATPIGWIIGIGAAFVGAAILIKKFWTPLAYFFAGVWEGLSPIAPLLHAISSAIGTVFSWFTALIKPVDSSAESLSKWHSAGEMLGKAILSSVVGPLANAIELFTTLKKLTDGNYFGSLKKNIAVASAISLLSAGNPASFSPSAYASSVDSVPVATQGAPETEVQPADRTLEGQRGYTAPTPLSAAPATPAITIHQPITMHITQQPGQSGEELARLIHEEIRQKQNESIALSMRDH